MPATNHASATTGNPNALADDLANRLMKLCRERADQDDRNDV